MKTKNETKEVNASLVQSLEPPTQQASSRRQMSVDVTPFIWTRPNCSRGGDFLKHFAGLKEERKENV